MPATRCEICGKGPQFGAQVSHAHNVSAKKRLNLANLLASLLLQAEILELKANPDRLAYGTAPEAKSSLSRYQRSKCASKTFMSSLCDASKASIA